MSVIICFITVPTPKIANFIAREIVRRRLGACVNAIPGVTSFFHWKGKIERASECLLVVKTLKNRFQNLKKCVEEIHPYSVPEIIAMPVTSGNKAYLDWIRETVY